MSQSTLPCQLHDYIEIACMYRYQVRLTLKNGQIIEGKAMDIHSSPDRREYLIIDNNRQQIELTQLTKMTVLTLKAKFNEVVFS